MPMTRSLLFTLMLTLTFGIAFPHFAAAQTEGMTQEEMIAAFKKQKTRGLVIAPATPVEPLPGVTEVAPVAEVAYDLVPKDEQVNINISFDFDSAALREDQKPKLVALCGAMTTADVQMFRILGHTDSSGAADYNERLSKLRAEEVKRYLVSDCGIPADRMEAVGVGKRFPFDPADPRADVNRRVEFQALS
jgi:outer membrane protein OmpA-like peptidoglycan-associated protein